MGCSYEMNGNHGAESSTLNANNTTSQTRVHSSESSACSESEPSILLALIHGNNAGPKDWEPIEQLVIQQAEQLGRARRLRVLAAMSNAGDTHGGVQLLGRRLADELVEFLIAPATQRAAAASVHETRAVEYTSMTGSRHTLYKLENSQQP